MPGIRLREFYVHMQRLKNIYHLFKAFLATIWYGFPSRDLTIIGVTGTDGKTTTTHLIYHILQSKGEKVSLISSVYAKIGNKEFSTGLHTTTPDPFFLQKLLRDAVTSSNNYMVLEVTSHALDQNRVFGIHFKVGVLTNITHEHLDYHTTYENYVRTKAKLLYNGEKILINRDDESFPLLENLLKKKKKNWHTYGFSQEADFHIDIGKATHKDLPDFNTYNYLAAYGAAKLLGVSNEHIVQALRTFQLPPGRLEVVHRGSFTVIVDFAHTPYAIDKVLQYVKKEVKPQGRIIHVFGSAGLRDYTKRPLMGEKSAKHADSIILTEEDYRAENPQKIASQIEEGLKKEGFIFQKNEFLGEKKTYTIIIDRKKAIQEAVRVAREGDVIIITGKGHEKSLCRGSKEYPWDDREAVLQVLEEKNI